ncbi:MAG: Tat pathway signal protein, partial [Rhodobacterales bacterium]|nr:Tat pathway signal protein [Rhodobacterales bacterium]
MKLDRRTFISLLGSTGVVFGLPAWLQGAHATEPFTGPYWVTIDAGGGWDPTMLCDPKGK